MLQPVRARCPTASATLQQPGCHLTGGLAALPMVEGKGIPLGRVLAPANRHDSPLLAATLDKLDDIRPLPGDITVHLDAGYDSQKTRDELASRGMTGKSPIRAISPRSRPGSAGTSSRMVQPRSLLSSTQQKRIPNLPRR